MNFLLQTCKKLCFKIYDKHVGHFHHLKPCFRETILHGTTSKPIHTRQSVGLYAYICVWVLFFLCTLGWHVMCVNALILFRWAASPKRDACREASRLAAEIHKQNLWSWSIQWKGCQSRVGEWIQTRGGHYGKYCPHIVVHNPFEINPFANDTL